MTGSTALKQSSPHSLQMLWARRGFGGGVPALPGGPSMEVRCLSSCKPLIKAIILNHSSAKSLRGVRKVPESPVGLISKVQGAFECLLWA